MYLDPLNISFFFYTYIREVKGFTRKSCDLERHLKKNAWFIERKKKKKKEIANVERCPNRVTRNIQFPVNMWPENI